MKTKLFFTFLIGLLIGINIGGAITESIHTCPEVDIKYGLEIRDVSTENVGYLIPDGKGSLMDVTKEEYNAYWGD